MKTLKLLALCALVTPAAADSLPRPISEMECLVGTWRGTGTVTMGTDVSKVDLTWTCQRTAARFGVLCTLALKGIPGLPVYAETDMFGYEPGSSTYHWFSVTNAGETHDHVAKPPTGNRLQFVYTGTQEGQPFKEVIDMELAKDGKSMTVRAETFAAGKSTSVFALKAKK